MLARLEGFGSEVRSTSFVTITVLGFLMGILYWDGIVFAAQVWFESPEYSHGVMIPFIAMYLVWQKRDLLGSLVPHAAWIGVVLVAAGLLLTFLGKLSAIFILIHYSLIIVLAGLVLSYWGFAGLRLLGMPLLFLVLMIPLPNFLYKSLSFDLQLLSSQLGVLLIRLFDISVFLEGNVIDLGKMKLEVAEACNGLRYLFPLMTVGFILAYFFRAPVWQRLFIFASTIPVTVLMNGFRIGMIGVLVEYWGPDMAVGFIHDFEGWIVFMMSCAVVLVEMSIFARMSGCKLMDCIVIDTPSSGSREYIPVSFQKPFIAAGVFVAVAALASIFISTRAESIPSRSMFSEFPLELSGWSGTQVSIDKESIDVLKLSDYLMADFYRPDIGAVNLYAAYYETQRAGQSAHSPRTCIPGGGWEIESIENRAIPLINNSINVNRVLIRKGDDRQLVYYWFQQRGRVITNEYAMKWYLLWDAISRQRSDGALMRLITRVDRKESESQAESRLNQFAQTLSPLLSRYVPD